MLFGLKSSISLRCARGVLFSKLVYPFFKFCFVIKKIMRKNANKTIAPIFNTIFVSIFYIEKDTKTTPNTVAIIPSSIVVLYDSSI